MTAIAKSFYRGVIPTASTTLYTVPTATKAVLTGLLVANPGSTASTVRLSIGGQSLLYDTSVAAGGSIALPLRQALAAGDAITASAQYDGISLIASGVEIS